MLKKTITYVDFNEETVSEDFYFHLSQAELVELEMSHDGGLSDSLKKIIEAEDGKAIIAEFKNIILSSYGKKSGDGRRFIKNQILRDEFESSEAYSVLFMELVTETDKAIEFVNGIVPGAILAEAARAGADLAIVPKSESVASETETRVRIYTQEEINLMPGAEALEIWELVKSGKARIEG